MSHLIECTATFTHAAGRGPGQESLGDMNTDDAIYNRLHSPPLRAQNSLFRRQPLEILQMFRSMHETSRTFDTVTPFTHTHTNDKLGKQIALV